MSSSTITYPASSSFISPFVAKESRVCGTDPREEFATEQASFDSSHASPIVAGRSPAGCGSGAGAKEAPVCAPRHCNFCDEIQEAEV